MFNRTFATLLLAGITFGVSGLSAQADHRWHKLKLRYPDFKIFQNDYSDEDEYAYDEEEDDEDFVEVRRESERQWWLDEDSDEPVYKKPVRQTAKQRLKLKARRDAANAVPESKPIV